MLHTYLPENAPILMFWMVRNPSELQENQLPLPNNQQYPYKQRLLNWAIKEPQRKIKLYYVSTGLNRQQIAMLNHLSDPNKGGKNNIEVIDFIQVFSYKYDLKYLHNRKIPFAWKIDMARLLMLIEAGPAIYFDFDILPTDKQIGKIIVNNHIGYAMGQDIADNKLLDVSVIVSTEKNNSVIRAAYDAANHFCSTIVKNDSTMLDKVLELLGLKVLYPELVWLACISIPALMCKNLQNCNETIIKLQESNESLYNKLIYILTNNQQSNIIYAYYKNERIMHNFNCKGFFKITRDLTWLMPQHNSIYATSENNQNSHSNTEKPASTPPSANFTTCLHVTTAMDTSPPPQHIITKMIS
ncbi:hypothetical protein [Candidatus Neoehrlichia procyonis]|uniref:Uncharacterized protein n=1 Tax=Candidatus Neoehrlichia procyonis str. RAC413 TaxID=1359163 RepID=A0A0F3NLK0_9RICK|nr:hypothetical protein [Candidatus Neoehrlichia lotoris]KJV68948.1 hypothetical protein NLO413_0320 [Candidatus Neoehrlichia lotoris str. RAC413]